MILNVLFLVFVTSKATFIKCSDIMEVIKYRHRYKMALINDLGSVFKFVIGNLDSSDGKFYTECIHKK